VWVHTHGWQPVTTQPTIKRTLATLQDRGIPTVSYHLDLYAGIPDRWAQYQRDPYMGALDHFYSVDPPLVEWLNANTRCTGHYLTAGVYDKECYLGQPYAEPLPVVFVGSYKNYHPTWPYRRQLVEWLQDRYGDMFTGFGGDFGATVRGDTLNRVYSSAQVVVGDSFSPNFDYPGYWSDRIPETLGRGGFLIHPRIPGIEDFYEDRKHLVLYTFKDFDELEWLIDYYLHHPDEREAIRLTGHEHVKNHHTYVNRWATITREVCP
jgi:hypothetical protein